MSAFPCPACTVEASLVVETRYITTGARRRRKCKACGHLFTTYETTEASMAPLIERKAKELLRVG